MKVTKCFNPRLNQYGYYMTDANGNIKALTYEDGLKQGLVMLEQIRAEIEKRMETIIGRYDNSIPEYDRPLCKCARNEARKECIEIIDKALKEQS